MYQGLGKVGVDAPVALLVGVGQGAAGHGAAQAHMIEFVAVGAQAGFDIAQAFATGELCKGHAAILVLATEAFDVMIAMVALNTAAQGMVGKMLHCLSEDQFAVIHVCGLPSCCSMEELETRELGSSSR